MFKSSVTVDNSVVDSVSLQRIYDRLAATPNDELPKVLDSLLPKLIPLINKDELRQQLLGIFQSCLKRIKPLKTLLPVDKLISLVSKELLPFACNFAIAFIDAGLTNYPRHDPATGSMTSILRNLPTFPHLSPQASSLCYYALHFIDELSNPGFTMTPLLTQQMAPISLLADYFLDISLVNGSLSKDSVGSIFPGLSLGRVNNLTSKKANWTAEEIRVAKLQIIQAITLNSHFVNTDIMTIILILSCDNDEQVSTQATFKLNGARTLFKVQENPAALLDHLCSLLIIQSDTNATSTDNNSGFIRESRTPLRLEVKIAIVHWMIKDMQLQLIHSSKSILKVAIAQLWKSGQHDSRDDSSSAQVYRKELLELLLILGEQLEEKMYHVTTLVFLKTVKRMLSYYVLSLHTGANPTATISSSLLSLPSTYAADVVSQGNLTAVATRNLCYNFVHQIAQRSANIVVLDAELVFLLFQLIDKENRDGIVNLCNCLNSVRSCYENSASKSGIQDLEKLLLEGRFSLEPKKRKAVLEWLKVLRQWDGVVLETMLLMADDENEIVRESVLKEFRNLREYIPESSHHTDKKGSLKFTIISDALHQILSQHQSDWFGDGNYKKPTKWHLIRELFSCVSTGIQATLNHELVSNSIVDQDYSNSIIWDGDDWWKISSAKLERPLNVQFLCAVVDCCFASIDRASSELPSHVKSSPAYSAIIQVLEESIQLLAVAVSYCDDPQCRSICRQDINLRRLLSLLNLPMRGSRSRESIAKVLGCCVVDNDANFIAQLKRSILFKISSPLNDEEKSSAILSMGCIAAVLYYRLEQPISNTLMLYCSGRGPRIIDVSDRVPVVEDNSSRLESDHAAVFAETKGFLHEYLDIATRILLQTGADTTQQSATVGETDNESSNPTSNKSNSLVILLSLQGVVAQGLFIARETLSPSGNNLMNPHDSLCRRSAIEEFLHSQIALVLEGIFAVIHRKSDPFEASLAIELITKSCTNTNQPTRSHTELAVRLWNNLFTIPYLSCPNPLIRFAVSESVWKLVSLFSFSAHSSANTDVNDDMGKSNVKTLLDQISDSDSVLSKIILPITMSKIVDFDHSIFFELLLDYLSVSVSALGSKERGVSATLLLVLSKLLSDHASLSHEESSTAKSNSKGFIMCQRFLSKEVIMQITAWALKLLQEKDTFIQDICCLTLCHIYKAAEIISDIANLTHKSLEAVAADVPSSQQRLDSLVAKEVIVVLTRERRKNASVGVAVAGESVVANNSNNGRENNASGVINRLLAGLNASREGNTGTGANNRDQEQENRQQEGQAQNQQQQQQQEPNEALTAAANRLAEEFGIRIEEFSNDATNNALLNAAREDEAAQQQHLIVYAILCKIAKKGGDQAILFACLPMLQRDVISSDTNTTAAIIKILSRYKAPSTAVVETERISRLVPLLYMHRFDPSPKIRVVMRLLWDQMVLPVFGNDMNVINARFETKIVSLLTDHLRNQQWREREAACSALESYLPSRDWMVVQNHLVELWSCSMNVLDDIRDSTRQAAIGFAKVLADQILRTCGESNKGIESIEEILRIFIPLLLEKGISAPSAEARGFSLGILLRLVKATSESGDTTSNMASITKSRKIHPLSKWLPELVSILVEAMSALEPQTLQYLQFHTSRLEITGDDLEKFRVQLSQQSPMQDALNACLQNLSINSLSEVPVLESVKYLNSHLQRGVGLASRVSAAQSISYLTEMYPHIMKEGGIIAFRSVIKTLMSMASTSTTAGSSSNTMKRAFVNTMGSLARVVHPIVVIEECNKAISLYIPTETSDPLVSTSSTDEKAQSAVGEILYEIVKRAGEKISDDGLWIKLIAVSYVGSFETRNGDYLEGSSGSNTTVTNGKDIWASTFAEILPMSGYGSKIAALSRTLPTIVKMLSSLMLDLSWNKRSQSMLVLNDILVTLSGEPVANEIGQLVEILFRYVPGNIWQGKYLIFDTLSVLANKFPGRLSFSGMVNQSESGEQSNRDLMTIDTGTTADEVNVLLTIADVQSKKKPIIDIDHESHDDVIKLNNTTASSSSREIVPTFTCSHTGYRSWKIDAHGLVEVLVTECQRGDKDYPLSCVRALSSLPWPLLSQSSSSSIFLHFLPIFCELTGIPCLTPSAIDSTGNVVQSNSKKRTFGEPADIIIPSSGISKASKIPQKNVVKGHAALFGSRYGSQDLPSRAYKPQVRSRPFPIGVSSSSSEDNSTLSNSETIESESVDLIASIAEMSGEEHSTDHVSISIADSVAVASKKLRSDPAFRMKLIECIGFGWPSASVQSLDQTIFTADNTSTNLQAVRVGLIEWVVRDTMLEIWSIRCAALHLLRKLIGGEEPNSRYLLTASSLHSCVQLIVSSIGEKKYSKLRLAGLGTLEALIQSGNFAVLLEAHREDVKGCLKQGALDAQPIVLETVARIQRLWVERCRKFFV